MNDLPKIHLTDKHKNTGYNDPATRMQKGKRRQVTHIKAPDKKRSDQQHSIFEAQCTSKEAGQPGSPFYVRTGRNFPTSHPFFSYRTELLESFSGK